MFNKYSTNVSNYLNIKIYLESHAKNIYVIEEEDSLNNFLKISN